LRLQVFRALVVAGPRGMTPGAMSEGSGAAPNTLSFHLKELAHAGLVTQQRDGRFLIYRADFERMNGLLAYLTENCCQGTGCRVDRPACPPSPSRSRNASHPAPPPQIRTCGTTAYGSCLGS
jgi:DNA-binding transcriptional ArsR family regulator